MLQETVHAGAVVRRERRAGWPHRQVPRYGSFGLALLIVAWIISWSQFKPLSAYYFFPIWLGYILVVDAAVVARRGTSLLRQDLRAFVRLFALSAAFWWAFEGLNRVVGNWHYLGAEGFTAIGYFVFASIAFSTVVPAVLETATLIGSFLPPAAFVDLTHRAPPYRRLLLLLAIGLCTFLAPFFWPQQAYGFLWLSGLLLFEPINWALGRPSILRQIAAGRLAHIVTLFGAGITCGLLWEMWNYYSMPKWYYVLPGIQAPRLFEMPLPGLLGYFPFAVELYATYNLLRPLVGRFSQFEAVLQAP